MYRLGLVIAAVGLFCVLPTRSVDARETRPWIHIEVDEVGEQGAEIRINLPLSLVDVAVRLTPEHVVSENQIHLEGHGISVSDLRRLWRELEGAGEGELVTIERQNEHVHIGRRGNRVLIEVDEEDGKHVHVEIPVSVVGALLSAEGEELNLKAAVDQLGSQRGEVLRVDGPDEQVRIWIGER